MDCDICKKYTLDETGFNCPNCTTDQNPFKWDTWFRFIYIIELDSGNVINNRKFMDKNPNMKEDAKCFYVGQTARCPDIRFKQHKTGYRSNRFVKEHGLWLRRYMYRKFNPIKDQDGSLKMEARVANILRNQGFGVWYN